MVSNADTTSTVVTGSPSVYISKYVVHNITDTAKHIQAFQTLSKEGALELVFHQYDGTWITDSIWKTKQRVVAHSPFTRNNLFKPCWQSHGKYNTNAVLLVDWNGSRGLRSTVLNTADSGHLEISSLEVRPHHRKDVNVCVRMLVCARACVCMLVCVYVSACVCVFLCFSGKTFRR